MSFFSKSSKGKHYKNANHGSRHYQRRGLFGNLFNLIVSKSGTGRYYDRTPRQNAQSAPGNGQHVSCRSCGANMPAGANFCFNCGSRVQGDVYCGSCGEKVPSGSKFCLKCGNRLQK